MDEYQRIILEIITGAGVAKSRAMQGIAAAQQGDAETALRLIEECKEELVAVHKLQTRLIQQEAAGEAHPVTLLMVHAQDHLMSALTTKDLAEHIVVLYQRLSRIEAATLSGTTNREG